MAISVTCSCGKALRVKDEWAGKTVTCPGCGGTFVVSAAGGRVNPAGAAGAANSSVEMWSNTRKQRASGEKPGIGAKFSISPMMMLIIGLILLVPTVVFLAKIGPLKAQKQWRELESQADSDVSSVVARALQSHLQKEGRYDPTDARWTPGVSAVTFEPNLLMVRLPEWITFTGKCSGGFFKGTYNPRTREVKAKVPGERTELDVTGRVKDGAVEAEIDGEPAKLDMTRRGKRDEEDLPPTAPRLKRK